MNREKNTASAEEERRRWERKINKRYAISMKLAFASIVISAVALILGLF